MEGYKKCEIGHLFKDNLTMCPYCPSTQNAASGQINKLSDKTEINLGGFSSTRKLVDADAVDHPTEIFGTNQTSNKETKVDLGYKGFSPLELVTIASIIQAEGDPQDFTKIAQVIYNRLKIGMPLQMNTTIEYAANLRGKIRLPYKELEVNSKYNTYKYRGLPPGPIGNPGQAALNASVNPESGDWLYFITVKPQDTRFTKSYDQFNIWADEFRKNEKAGLFK